MENLVITQEDSQAWQDELIKIEQKNRLISSLVASVTYSGGYLLSLFLSNSPFNISIITILSAFPAISIMLFYFLSLRVKVRRIVFNFWIFCSLSFTEAILSTIYFKPTDAFLSIGLIPILVTFALLTLWEIKYSILAVFLATFSNILAFIFFNDYSVNVWITHWTINFPISAGMVVLINFRYVNSRKTFFANRFLQKSKDALSKKNAEVIASINYAKRIQEAVLPSLEKIKNISQQFFVLFKPKDIVSGDFYFTEEINNKTIIAVADCTGHGVPGALMSMIGIQILKDVILKNALDKPAEILDALQSELRATLKDSNDGMDIVVISLEKNQSEIILEYAGAMNPFYYVVNNVFYEIKADKVPIGGRTMKPNFHFVNHVLHLKFTDNIKIYLTTDGFQDQFGGEKCKKFMVKNFRNLLLQTSNLSMNEQLETLKNNLTDWQNMAHENQTDDITVIGLQL